MKILVYNANFHSISGTVKYLLPVLKELSYKNEITLLGDKHFDTSLFKKAYDIDLKNIDYRYLNYIPVSISAVYYIKHIKKCLQISEMSSNYDVFINNQFENHWQIKPQAGINIGVTYAPVNPYFLWDRPQNFKFIKNTLRNILWGKKEKHNYINNYQHILTVSKFSSEWFKYFWKYQNISVIYPWIDFMKEEKSFQKTNSILTVLRYKTKDSAQRIKEIIESFQHIHDPKARDEWHFTIALGLDPSISKKDYKYIEFLKKLSEGYPISFVINPDINKLQELYAKCRIFWHLTGLGINPKRHPEKLEPFGTVVIDAMKNKCVPVLANNGGYREIVENNISGFKISGFIELIERTRYLMDNKNEYDILSANAYKRSLTFSKERFILQFKEAFPELFH